MGKSMLSLDHTVWHGETIEQERHAQPGYMRNTQPELDGLLRLDPQAISSIHQRYFPEIFRYARYRIGDETVAEDIAGEALTRLLESVHSGSGPHTSLRGWLMSTTSNLINDHLRHAYAHPIERLPDELDLHAESPGPSQHAEREERDNQLREALAKLTPDQQQVIAFRFGNGYSLEETATMMKKKVNAIKALQFRALAALRRYFGEEVR